MDGGLTDFAGVAARFDPRPEWWFDDTLAFVGKSAASRGKAAGVPTRYRARFWLFPR